MVEVVSQIKTAEAQAEDIKRSARHQVKQMTDEAESAGKSLLEAETQKAGEQAAGILSEAQSKADAYLAEFGAQSKTQCDEMAAAAAARLNKAAAFIVERIVQSL